jgi:hypothetical protein
VIAIRKQTQFKEVDTEINFLEKFPFFACFKKINKLGLKLKVYFILRAKSFSGKFDLMTCSADFRFFLLFGKVEK